MQAMTEDKNYKIAADTSVRNDSNCSLLATLRGHQQVITASFSKLFLFVYI